MPFANVFSLTQVPWDIVLFKMTGMLTLLMLNMSLPSPICEEAGSATVQSSRYTLSASSFRALKPTRVSVFMADPHIYDLQLYCNLSKVTALMCE